MSAVGVPGGAANFAVVREEAARLGLAIRRWGDGGDRGWQIAPLKQPGGGRVRLGFVDLGGLPEVITVENHSVESGWGRRMVSILRALYPLAPEWRTTLVRDSGLVFWIKMQREVGIVLINQRGGPLLSDDWSAKRLADINIVANRMKRRGPAPDASDLGPERKARPRAYVVRAREAHRRAEMNQVDLDNVRIAFRRLEERNAGSSESHS